MNQQPFWLRAKILGHKTSIDKGIQDRLSLICETLGIWSIVYMTIQHFRLVREVHSDHQPLSTYLAQPTIHHEQLCVSDAWISELLFIIRLYLPVFSTLCANKDLKRGLKLCLCLSLSAAWLSKVSRPSSGYIGNQQTPWPHPSKGRMHR